MKAQPSLLPPIFPPAATSHVVRWVVFLAASFLCFGSVTDTRAQDTEESNPTGRSGDFNGEVTTGGGYDPFTGNIKRRVTDLTVPGANGAYGLAFARTYNSQRSVAANDRSPLGDGGNWRHCYQWNLEPTTFSPTTGEPIAYTLAYPDGAVVCFRPASGRRFTPNTEFSYVWRGPSAVVDRLEILSPNYGVCLHLADGGLVNFNGKPWPTSITDPNGAVTQFSYVGATGYLDKVTEPGGRWLKFNYVTVTQNYTGPNGGQRSASWTLLASVQASNGQSVSYTVASSDAQHPYTSQTGNVHYYVLTDVNYGVEDTARNVAVHATYTYDSSSGTPLLSAATDPHYAGAMTSIRYAGDLAGGSYCEEQNFNTGERVSRLDRTFNSTGAVTTSQETRGDVSTLNHANVTRSFSYVPPSIPGEPVPSSKSSLLRSRTDFQGNTTSYTYYGIDDKDTNGKSFLRTTTDPRNRTTSYGHEPLTGKVTAVTQPDGRTSTAVWSSKDGGDGRLPYYLQQTTNERGDSTTYHRYADTGLVNQIDYPEDGHEYFSYIGFNGPQGVYYKVANHQTRLQAHLGYTYGNNGGSGHGDLLTAVTRTYADGDGVAHTETTNFHYDALDRVDQTTDARGVVTKFAYNGRHQLTATTHGSDNTSVTCAYDDNGNRTGVTDELGHATTTAYDEYRRVYYTVLPVNDGVTASRYRAFDYSRRDNDNNLVGSGLSHTSGAWGVSWTGSGRASRRVFTPNGWVSDQYEGMNVNWNGPTVTPQPASGYVRHRADYDATGQVQTSYDALNFATTYSYDNCNRPWTATDPLGHVTTSLYYANGEAAATGSGVRCDGLPKSVAGPGPDLSAYPTVTTLCAGYNHLGEGTKTLAPYLPNASGDPVFNRLFVSGYDVAGDLTSQTDGAQAQGQHVTGYAYDMLGRQAKCTYPDGTAEKWAYDASGNLASYTNRGGAVCTYAYDGRNRCTSYGWNDHKTSPVYYSYDAASRLVENSNWYSDLRYSYDDANVRLSEDALTAQPTRRVTRFTHDLDGNVDSIAYPGGDVLRYKFDHQNRCKGVYASNNQALGLYSYQGDRLSQRWLLCGQGAGYGGVDTHYEYQNDGRINYVWHFQGNPAGEHTANRSLALQFYGHAPDGRVSWTARSGGGDQVGGSTLEDWRGEVYYYSADGRLRAAYRDVGVDNGWPGRNTADQDSRVDPAHLTDNSAGGGPSSYQAYSFDAAGNRTGWVQAGQSQSCPGADGENRLVGWAYDANGNVGALPGGWSFDFDAEHRLLGASGPGGQRAAFTYDAAGRLSKWRLGQEALVRH